MPAKQARRPVGTPRTQRMRRLECEAACGYSAYVSRRWMTVGLPACPCGSRLWPSDLDDAAAVLTPEELAEHPAAVEYAQALRDVFHGQAPHWKRGRALQSPDAVVQAKLDKAQRERARAARLNALRDHSPQAASRPAEDIPF